AVVDRPAGPVAAAAGGGVLDKCVAGDGQWPRRRRYLVGADRAAAGRLVAAEGAVGQRQVASGQQNRPANEAGGGVDAPVGEGHAVDREGRRRLQRGRQVLTEEAEERRPGDRGTDQRGPVAI